MLSPSDVWDEREKYLIEIIEMLKEDYNKAAKPYLDELVRLRNAQPKKIFVSIEQMEKLGLILDKKRWD